MTENDLSNDERAGLDYAHALHNARLPEAEHVTVREFFDNAIRERCAGWRQQQIAERERDPENAALVRAVIAAPEEDREAIKAFAAERLGLA